MTMSDSALGDLGVSGRGAVRSCAACGRAPTDTCQRADGSYCATDFALMYDGVVDFPQGYIAAASTPDGCAAANYCVRGCRRARHRRVAIGELTGQPSNW